MRLSLQRDKAKVSIKCAGFIIFCINDNSGYGQNSATDTG